MDFLVEQLGDVDDLVVKLAQPLLSAEVVEDVWSASADIDAAHGSARRGCCAGADAGNRQDAQVVTVVETSAEIVCHLQVGVVELGLRRSGRSYFVWAARSCRYRRRRNIRPALDPG